MMTSKVLNFYKLGKVIPDGAVFIGRAMPHLGLKGSKFANPFKITEDETREVVIAKYKVWLWQQIKSGYITLEDLLELENKDVVCFCKQPDREVACHGDIVLAAVVWARQKYNNIHGHWNWEDNL